MGRLDEHQLQRYVMQPGATRCTYVDAVLTALSRKGSPCLTPAHVRCSLPVVDERKAKFMVISWLRVLQIGLTSWWCLE